MSASKLRLLSWIAIVGGIFLAGNQQSQAADNVERSTSWHQWRGPNANGVSETATPPLSWSENKNIRWKKPIEGLGNATPIVWGDKLFVLTAVDTRRVDPSKPAPADQPERSFGIVFPNTYYQFVVLCLDRSTGEEIWEKVVAERVPNEGHHGDNSFASCSPFIDGEHIYCWFGSQGLYCLDLDGNLLWEKDLGPVETRRSFGEGTSPVAHDGRLIINRDHEGQSSIIVLDAATGEEIWTRDRDELSSWATPLIVEKDGIVQVIVNAANRVRSYNLDDGSIVWECGGQVSNVTPSPVTDGEFVYCMSGYRGSSAMAISLDSKGDVTGTDQIAWQLSQGTPYVPSPILYDGLLYFTQSNNAILTCVDPKSGDVLLERTRVPDVRAFYGSPVAAQGRIYLTGRDGETVVIKADSEFEVLATNQLDDHFDSSAVLVEDAIYLRGKENLYCIGE
ncbi:PQQ-binding-like beta-propeller repeat protein [Thalassoglobus sp. JC818]|uniref:PQQ-binding-like beta-propeller repeat protein n=1 Tax=Thalassoglobus sp. JC818 TaxID=3232136 RepID=UPI00345A23FE